MRSPLSKVLFDPAELALKVGNDSGMMPELGTETQVAQGEKTVQQLLCNLASVFSVRENQPQAANTGVHKDVALAWEHVASLGGILGT